jgi:hypothetical protein
MKKQIRMKIKTSMLFKIRRLGSYTKRRLPGPEVDRKRLAAGFRLINEEKMEREVFNSCVMLKNLAIVHKDSPMSADFILEELMDNSLYLRNVYADMLEAYRNGGGEEAFDIFWQRVPIKEVKNFAMVLSKIDMINPAELVTHMRTFEEGFAAARMTRGMKRAERRSVITTAIATATIFAILLNFVIVVVFMDAMAMLGQAF